MSRISSRPISSRPYGTFRLSNFYPGLRPGLNSAVPAGLNFMPVGLTQGLRAQIFVRRRGESLEPSLDQSRIRHTCIRKQASPRSIKRKPSLRAEPTCWQLRNMQQPVATGADQLRAVPSQKISRGFSNPSRVGKHTKANRATPSLILEYPPKGE